MIVRFKKLHKDAVVPKHARPGDAAVDLTAVHMKQVYDNGIDYVVYKTGLAVEIPQGYYGQLHPRSSIFRTGLVLANSVGIIDSGYRGEIQFVFYKPTRTHEIYKVGDRVGQMVILPYQNVVFQEIKELSRTERGDNGFGSTGR